MSCSHERVVRLEVGGKPYWLCTWCNAQFVEKSAVDYKLCHVTTELAKRMIGEASEWVQEEEDYPSDERRAAEYNAKKREQAAERKRARERAGQ